LVCWVGTHTHSWLADSWRNEIHLSGEKRVYWRANPCTYADSLRTLRLTLAADRAIETRRTVVVAH